jgi:hypothetical protein
MRKNEFSTACGLAAMALGGMAEATTGTNTAPTYFVPNISVYVQVAQSPSNYLPAVQQAESVTVVDVIQRAEKTLGLSKQHLAKVFLTSRQNLYNLLKNPEQKPQQETENRAKKVNEALNIISSNCPHKLGASTLTVKIEDKRLFDILINDNINLEQVALFSNVIAKRINKQSASALPEHIAKQEEFLNRPNAI